VCSSDLALGCDRSSVMMAQKVQVFLFTAML